MSRTFHVVPLLLTAHLGALAVSAIPDPEALRGAAGTRGSVDDAVSRRIRPTLDTAAAALVSGANVLWHITTPVRPLARSYARILGLNQNWKMFSNPSKGSQFLRFRHFVAETTSTAGVEEQVFTELVFPAAPNRTVRGLGAYWQAHRDKAASNAIEAYYRQRNRRRAAGTPEPREGDTDLDAALSRSFVPLARYYQRRFAATLGGGHKLVRTEAWFGWASSPHRGERRMAASERDAALSRYVGGPVAEGFGTRAQPLDSMETEADIRWTLLHVLQP
jgi:hypothetical protein